MNLAKMRVGPTALLSFLLLFVGVLGYWTAGGARRQAAQFREDTLRKLQYSSRLNAYQAESYARALRLIESDSPELQQTYWEQGHAYRVKVDEILKEYDLAIPAGAAEERQAFNNFVESRKQYRAVTSRLVEMATNGQAVAAQKLIDSEMVPAYQNYTMAGDVLYNYEILAGNQRALELDRACTKAQFLTAFICIGVFLAGFLTLFVVFLFTRASTPAELTH